MPTLTLLLLLWFVLAWGGCPYTQPAVYASDYDEENGLIDTFNRTTSSHGVASLQAAGAARALSSFYIKQGRFTEAERYLKHALVATSGYSEIRIRGKELTSADVWMTNVLMKPENLPANFEVADVLDGFADLYRARGRLADSERILRRCLEMYKSLANNDFAGTLAGQTSPFTLQVYASIKLASVLSEESSPAEAEKLLQQSLALCKEGKGVTQNDLLDTLTAMARFYRSQGRETEASQYESEVESMK